MRRLLITLLVFIALGIAGFFVLTDPRVVSPGPEVGTLPAPDVENGKLLFAAGGCASCHATPGQDDKTRLGGGLELGSPFGKFHSPNISPHTRDGIGNWGTADYIQAMAAGDSPAGQHLYPSFPYTSYRLMTPMALLPHSHSAITAVAPTSRADSSAFTTSKPVTKRICP